MPRIKDKETVFRRKAERLSLGLEKRDTMHNKEIHFSEEIAESDASVSKLINKETPLFNYNVY